jgi:hypothetical protein
MTRRELFKGALRDKRSIGTILQEDRSVFLRRLVVVLLLYKRGEGFVMLLDKYRRALFAHGERSGQAPNMLAAPEPEEAPEAFAEADEGAHGERSGQVPNLPPLPASLQRVVEQYDAEIEQGHAQPETLLREALDLQAGETLASVLPLTEQNISDMDEPSLGKFVAGATAHPDIGRTGPLKDSLLLVYEVMTRSNNRKTVARSIDEFDPEIRETLKANLARLEGLSKADLDSRIAAIHATAITEAPARKLLDDDPEKLYEFIVLALLLRDKVAFQSPEYQKHANSLMHIMRVLKDHGLAGERAAGKSKVGIEQIQNLPEPLRPQLEASWRRHEAKTYQELQAVDDSLADQLKDTYGLNKALRNTSEKLAERNVSVDEILKSEDARPLFLERVAVMLLMRWKTPKGASVTLKSLINTAFAAMKKWAEEGAVTDAAGDVGYWMPDYPERLKPEFLEIQQELSGKSPAELGAMVDPLEAELKGTRKLIPGAAIVSAGEKMGATEEARQKRRLYLKLVVIKNRLVRVGTADEKRVYRAWVNKAKERVLK